MLKNITKLECEITNRKYQLLCDIDSPLTDVKEALFQFQKYVGQIEDNLKLAAAQKAQFDAAQTQPIVEAQNDQPAV